MITNYKINQPITLACSKERKIPRRTESADNQAETFLRRSQKRGRKTIQAQHYESHLPFRAGQILSGFLQRKSFSNRDTVFKPAKEALDASLKGLARQGMISSTKHRRPISSEDLEAPEALYAAN